MEYVYEQTPVLFSVARSIFFVLTVRGFPSKIVRKVRRDQEGRQDDPREGYKGQWFVAGATALVAGSSS